MAKKKAVVAKKETTYTKEQLVSSKKYDEYADILNVVLDDDKEYSFKETDDLLNEFLKGKVD